MKWVLIVMGAVVLAGVLIVAIGAALPVAHSATLDRRMEGRPAEVWAVMTAVDDFPTWRPGVESVERLPDADGRPVWRERASTGPLTMEVVGWEPPRRLVTRIADEGLPFGGTWTYRIEPEGNGTRVTITEDGEVYNPFFRFVARFVMGHEGTLRTYLDDLEARMAAGPSADPAATIPPDTGGDAR